MVDETPLLITLRSDGLAFSYYGKRDREIVTTRKELITRIQNRNLDKTTFQIHIMNVGIFPLTKEEFFSEHWDK